MSYSGHHNQYPGGYGAPPGYNPAHGYATGAPPPSYHPAGPPSYHPAAPPSYPSHAPPGAYSPPGAHPSAYNPAAYNPAAPPPIHYAQQAAPPVASYGAYSPQHTAHHPHTAGSAYGAPPPTSAYPPPGNI